MLKQKRRKGLLAKTGMQLQQKLQRAFRNSLKHKKRYMPKKKRDARRKWLWLLLVFFVGLFLWQSQDTTVEDGSTGTVTETPTEDYTDQEFIQLIGEYAVAEYPKSQVLPSIVVAQAVLESDFGRSDLSSKYFNLFGRKAYSESEPSVDLPTQEFVNGAYVTVDEPFRVYASWQESVADHGELLANGTSWNNAHYDQVINAADYQHAAYALQEAGYATDPNYAETLIDVIEAYDLTKFDDLVK